MTLSVCLIVLNESAVLARCLDCVKDFADQIVVVDTGSSDDTVEIARSYTDDVFHFDWNDDFSAVRNYAFSKATCDFVMWIDADDVVTEENRAKLKKLVSGAANFDMVYLPYAAAFEGDRVTFSYYRERIFRRSLNCKFVGRVHEVVSPQGKIIYADAVIEHRKNSKRADNMRNLNIYRRAISRGEKLSARDKFYYGRELFFNGFIVEAAAVLEDFLSGDGWRVNKAEACLNLFWLYLSQGNKERAYFTLLKSLYFCKPNAETCCLIGEKFLNDGDLNAAAFWYEEALRTPNDMRDGGFYSLDYGEFIPCLQLCVICDRLGEYEKAAAYNERAGKIRPDDKNYISNKRYFKEKLGY